MKLHITKRGSRNYIDEFLYIVTKIKKFQKDPHTKAHRLFNYFFVYLILDILSLPLFIYFYLHYKDIIFLILIGGMIFVTIFTFVYLIVTHKRIIKYLSSKQVVDFEINNDGIFYSNEEYNAKLEWSNIKYIIFNKHSIVFIPIELKTFVISISTEYKKDVVKAISIYKHEDLIIYN